MHYYCILVLLCYVASILKKQNSESAGERASRRAKRVDLFELIGTGLRLPNTLRAYEGESVPTAGCGPRAIRSYQRGKVECVSLGEI